MLARDITAYMNSLLTKTCEVLVQCSLMFRFTNALIFLRFNWKASYKSLMSE